MNHHIPITPRMRQQQLRSRIQCMTWVLIIGSFFAGITALPLASELDIAVRFAATKLPSLTGLVNWLTVVRDALHDVYGKYPFIAYGTDWLAFAHIVIAIAFAGGLTHPLRNAWIYKWGALVSVLVIPWALICGEVRHIPLGWRLIDCSFGVVAVVPCFLAMRWCRELEQLRAAEGRVVE